MHSIWHIPELVIHITTFLEERDLAHCYHISQQWRNILKANIPPHRLPLPDVPSLRAAIDAQSNRVSILPQEIRNFAAQIQEYESEQNSAQLGSTLFFWRDSAYWNMLKMVKPFLHPWVAKHAVNLCKEGAGLRSLVDGKLDIQVQTSCIFQELEALIDSKMESQVSPLTEMHPTSVDIFCVKGAEWDTTYKLGQDWDRRCRIRVEGHKGVRMVNVVDEIRGCLMHNPDGPENERLILQWHFNEPDWATNQNLLYIAGML